MVHEGRYSSRPNKLIVYASSQSHGHASEPLTLAAASAAGRYGHVLFPSGTHEPALQLAEKLLSTVGQGWAGRVFYSDNGSTGMEVALKMALRAAGRRYGWDGEVGQEIGVIGLRGGYHGDTVGWINDMRSAADLRRLDRWMPLRLRLSMKLSTGKRMPFIERSDHGTGTKVAAIGSPLPPFSSSAVLRRSGPPSQINGRICLHPSTRRRHLPTPPGHCAFRLSSPYTIPLPALARP